MREAHPFGDFLLLERIAVGGMAEVFKAVRKDDASKNIVALKRILPSLGSDKEFVKMFEDEADLVERLKHKNIAEILSHGHVDGAHFIEMEYISGRNLLQIQERYKRGGLPMPIPWVAFVLSKILSGLGHAHSKKDSIDDPLLVIHRDCSPQNMLVGYDGEIRLIDFGIAKAAISSIHTNEGILKGKFGYMSPEQVRGDELDARSDLFSIGTVFAELVTGEHPFKGDSDFETLENVREADVVKMSSLRGDASKLLDGIVEKALAKEKNNRYQDAESFRLDLEKLLLQASDKVDTAYVSHEVKRLFKKEHIKEMAWIHQVSHPESETDEERESRPQTAQVFVSSQTNEETAIEETNKVSGGDGIDVNPVDESDKPHNNKSSLWWWGLAFCMLALGFIGFGVMSKNRNKVVDPKNEIANGVLAIVVADGHGGNLYLNDVEQGFIEAEKTYNGLEAGTYSVRLEREGYEPFSETRTLLKDSVEIISAKFLAKPKTSIVLLEGLKEEDRIYLNDQEVSFDMAKLGLVVESKKPHEIVIRRRAKVIDRFDVELERGETLAHPIPELKKSEPLPPKQLDQEVENKEAPVFPLELNRDLYEEDEKNSGKQMGYFTAFTKPYARVFVDGVDTGKMTPITPSNRLRLAPGRHKIAFRVDDQVHDYVVVIKNGETFKFAKVLKEEQE